MCFIAQQRRTSRLFCIQILPYEQCALQSSHGCLLLFLGRFCVHIHCSGNIRMTHDLLNDLQVGFVFAETGAERMPEMVAAKVGQENRVTIFCISLGCFFLIIVCADCMNRTIDHSRQIDLAFPRAEHKSRITINFIRGLRRRKAVRSCRNCPRSVRNLESI